MATEGAWPTHYLKLHSRSGPSCAKGSLGITLYTSTAGFPYSTLWFPSQVAFIGGLLLVAEAHRIMTAILARDRLTQLVLLLGTTVLLVIPTGAAPVGGEDASGEVGCYHMLEYYKNGDQIRTNEPCLNCTCGNNTLRCFLKTCPYTKPIGLDCVVERSDNVCCPTIRCPEVPVMIPASEQPQTIGHFTESPEGGDPFDGYESEGCMFDGVHYSDGAQVPSSYGQPCELCYCIRNRTACVFQECTLNVSGCVPQYKSGVCCPTSYNCDEPSPTTTTTTTTTTLKPSEVCLRNGATYESGAVVPSPDKCQKCYCLRGSFTCAVHDCTPPSVGCVPLETKDTCCPVKYDCSSAANVTVPVPQEKVDETATVAEVFPSVVDTGSSSNETEETATTNRPATITHVIVASHIPVFVVSEAAATTPQPSSVEEKERGGEGQEQESPKTEIEEKDDVVVTETPLTPDRQPPQIEPELTTQQPPVQDYTIFSEDPDKEPESIAATTAPSVDIHEKEDTTPQESRQPSDQPSHVSREPETQTLAQDPLPVYTTSSSLEVETADDRKDTEAGGLPTTEAFFVTEEESADVSVTESREASSGIETKTTPVTIFEPEATPQQPQETPALPREEQTTPEVVTAAVTQGKPEVIVTEVPIPLFVTEQDSVPGEGDCLQNGITYKSSYAMPSVDPCQVNCTCRSSLKVCERVLCESVPSLHANDSCVQIFEEGFCCPRYICEGTQHPTGITDSHSLVKSNETEVTEAPIIATTHRVVFLDRIDTTHLPIAEEVSTVFMEQPQSDVMPTTGVPIVKDSPTQDVTLAPERSYTTHVQAPVTETTVKEEKPEVVFTLEEDDSATTLPAIVDKDLPEVVGTTESTKQREEITTGLATREGGDIVFVTPEQEETASSGSPNVSRAVTVAPEPEATFASNTTQELPALESSTPAPELETSAPEYETQAPEREAPAPPLYQTQSPEQETTPAPEYITQEPVPEKEAPEAPEVTTPAPESETESPEREATVHEKVITFAPEQEPSTPEQETSAPELDTFAPEQETAAPELGTVAPGREETVLELETKAPEQEVTVPEHETESPEQVTTLEHETQAPEQEVTISEHGTQSPEREVTVPEHLTQAPVRETPDLEHDTESPEKEAPDLEHGTPAPEQETSSVTNETSIRISESQTQAPDTITAAPEVATSAPEFLTSAPETKSPAPDSEPSIAEVVTLVTEAETAVPEVDRVDKEESVTILAPTSIPELKPSIHENKTSIPEIVTPSPTIDSSVVISETKQTSSQEFETEAPETETQTEAPKMAPGTESPSAEAQTSFPDSPPLTDEAITFTIESETSSPERESPETVAPEIDALTELGDTSTPPAHGVPSTNQTSPESEVFIATPTTPSSVPTNVTQAPEVKSPITFIPETETVLPEIDSSTTEGSTHETATVKVIVPEVTVPTHTNTTETTEAETETAMPKIESSTPEKEEETTVPQTVTTPVPKIEEVSPTKDVESPKPETEAPVPETTAIEQGETSASQTRSPETVIHDIPFPQETVTSYSSPEPLHTTIRPVTTTLDPHDYEDPTVDHDYPTGADFGVPIPSENFTLQDGDCIYDGLLYVSAQQIPRDDPCDFCFCFRGDIICLKQSCPPPIEECFQEPIPGFCCPRFECPVTALTLNLTDTRIPYPMSSHYGRYRSARAVSQTEVVVCAYGHNFYNEGESIRAASGPCMDCVCGSKGTMSCMPKPCEPSSLWQTLQGLKQTPVRTKKAFRGSYSSWR